MKLLGALKAVWNALGQAAWAVIITLAIIAITAYIVNWHGTDKAESWMACLDAGVCSGSPQGKTAPSVVPVVKALAAVPQDPATIARLNNQLEHIRHRADYHLQITRDFYVSYYYSLTMALFLGAGAAILLFFISQTGWTEARPWQVASFIITTSATAAFGAFPTLYTQQDNIEQNKELYLLHRALKGEILSYAVTGEPLDRAKLGLGEGEPVTAGSFVRYVDRRMTELHKLPLGFDYSRLPADYLAGVPSDHKQSPKPGGQPPLSDPQRRPPVARAGQTGS